MHHEANQREPRNAENIRTRRSSKKTTSRANAGIPNKRRTARRKNNQGEQTGKQRISTCLNCEKTYDTIGGKLNHLRYNEKCRKAPQRETFENKCQECGRQFTSPCRLKEHHKYICTQQETDEEEEERETNEKDNHENQNQNMPICDEETREREKSPKTSTEEAEKEETDSERKRNNTKRTKAQGKKEEKNQRKRRKQEKWIYDDIRETKTTKKNAGKQNRNTKI